jgi:3'-phosphoadenosine 5'-phosphosulfate sulfotransferase (PAPS reductase)/FAD synthetase
VNTELAEKLAGREVVASISGGKDSAAMALHFMELGIPFRSVFADTTWEHPKTYEYLTGPLTKKIGPIDIVRGDQSFEELIRSKGMFPARLHGVPQGRPATALLQGSARRSRLRECGGDQI